MIRISIMRSGVPLGERVLEGEITIGRATDREIVLSDPQVSRLHVVIKESDGQCMVIDQGSRNGTMIEGRRLTKNLPTPWGPGQELAIREFVLRVMAHVEAVPKDDPLDAAEPFEPEQTFVVAGAAGGREDAPEVPEPQGLAEVDPTFHPTFEPTIQPAIQPAAQPQAAGQPGISATAKDLLRASLLGPSSAWTSARHAYLVADVVQETHDVVTLRFVPKEPRALRYLPGQSVTLSVPVEGGAQRRAFAISSSPSRPFTLDLTVKRVPGDPVSSWLADHLAVGDEVLLEAPSGQFSCFHWAAPKMLFLVGGSGMAQVMGMLRWITDVSAPVDVAVLNSIRTPGDLIFGAELESIAARHSSVSVTVTMTRSRACPGGWLGLSGRVDSSRLRAAVPDLVEREVFLCGPAAFTAAMVECLMAEGVPADRIHQEGAEGRHPQPGLRAPRVPAVRPTPAEPMLEPDGSFGTMILDGFSVPKEGELSGEASPVDVHSTYVPPSADDDHADEPSTAIEAPDFEPGQTFIPPPNDAP